MSKSRNHDGHGRLTPKASLQLLPSCRKESAHGGRKSGVVRRMFDSISDMQRAQKQTDHSVGLLRRNQQILLQRSDSLTVTCQRTSAIVDQLLSLFSLKPAGEEDRVLPVSGPGFQSESCSDGPRPAKLRREFQEPDEWPSEMKTEPLLFEEEEDEEVEEEKEEKEVPHELHYTAPGLNFPKAAFSPQDDELDAPELCCVKKEEVDSFP